MARVDEWFGDWLGLHLTVHPREDWPDPDDAREFYAAWRKAFVLNGLSREDADDATDRMAAAPPRFVAEHLPAILAAARAACAERAAAGQGHPPDTREAAEAAARGCEDCGGQGLAVRWRRRSAGHPHGPTVALYCRCPMGRWLEQSHRGRSPEVRRRLLDLADHPWLWGDEFRAPPLDPAYRPATTIRPGEVVRPVGPRGAGLGPLPPFVPAPEKESAEAKA